jgi:hypothetical protein
MAKYFVKSASYKQAEDSCFPSLVEKGLPTTRECQIAEEKLKRVMKGSRIAEQAAGAPKGSVFQQSKMEMLRNCDQCISGHIKGYAPLLEADFRSMNRKPRVKKRKLRKPASSWDAKPIQDALGLKAEKLQQGVLQNQLYIVEDTNLAQPSRGGVHQGMSLNFLLGFAVFAAVCVFFALRLRPPESNPQPSSDNGMATVNNGQYNAVPFPGSSPFKRRRSSTGL